ncbi:MAG: class I SAM-dependent methyltransferase [Acetobacteraceae bacterium]|nr:class I SAM-dependent methyltransferase [Acetobacteraceae bacterium]
MSTQPLAIGEVLALKYGPPDRMGWSPALRSRFGYRTPDDWYEALLFDLIGEETEWLDVGCGRAIFPSNPAGAAVLARRCRRLVGLDPSDNVLENPLLHERAQCVLQDYRTDRRFDVVTLRMVAEHIDDPAGALAALARLVKPGGRVVVYTVERLSPATIVSTLTPLGIHHVVKKILWNTEERDTFPTVYKMNTRHALKRLFQVAGFREESFRHLDDCRAFARWRWSNVMELAAWRCLRAVGLRYPEACILATYRQGDESDATDGDLGDKRRADQGGKTGVVGHLSLRAR